MRPSRPHLAPALLLAGGLALGPVLAACGGSSEEPAAEASASAEAASPGDYGDLLDTLSEQSEAVRGATSAEEINQAADFPEGVEVGLFEPEGQGLCIADAGKQIAVSITPEGLVADQGDCEDGEEVARLAPDPQDDTVLVPSGDEDVAAALEESFRASAG